MFHHFWLNWQLSKTEDNSGRRRSLKPLQWLCSGHTLIKLSLIVHHNISWDPNCLFKSRANDIFTLNFYLFTNKDKRNKVIKKMLAILTGKELDNDICLNPFLII